MKLKFSNSNKKLKRKRMALSAMLDSEYFFHRSGQIHMALKNNRILSKDFHIKRAKSKLDMGKKRRIINQEKKNTESNISEESIFEEKKDIPLELYFLLLEYQNKFLKENTKFQTIKNYNDEVLSFWHYINESSPKKERILLLKKYFPEGDEKINNLYSDEVQKLSKNLFKSNPLITYDNFSEIFFHYLSEFVNCQKDENKMNNAKQKVVKFLEKLKDYLEYIEIIQDSDIDSISRDIKVKNSKFVKEFGARVDYEMKKLKEKANMQNIKDIKNSTKMINETKNTLISLDKNRNVFEDPKNFDATVSYNFNKIKINKSNSNSYFNNINLKNLKSPASGSSDGFNKKRFFSPNKTGRMSSTLSTSFFLLIGKVKKDL